MQASGRQSAKRLYLVHTISCSFGGPSSSRSPQRMVQRADSLSLYSIVHTDWSGCHSTEIKLFKSTRVSKVACQQLEKLVEALALLHSYIGRASNQAAALTSCHPCHHLTALPHHVASSLLLPFLLDSP
jgi:hypothetical protein